MTDIDDAYAYGSDPEWGRYLWNTPHPYAREHAVAFVTASVSDTWVTEARFAVELNGRAIGGVRLYLTDVAGKVAGMGYNLARAHWGRGYATEAVDAVLAYAFESTGLHRVYATVDGRNQASMRVLEKLGFQREAVLRQHHLHRGEYADEVVYGMLREEWRTETGELKHLD